MDGDFGKAQAQGGLVAGVADDNDAVLVQDERLAEAELLDGAGYGGSKRSSPKSASATSASAHAAIMVSLR